MTHFNTEFKLNKKKSSNFGKRTKLNTHIVTLTLISLILISSPITLFSTTVFAEEPLLPSIFNELGFTNVSLSEIETFPAGSYQATLLAEFGYYHNISILSYYLVETSDYQTIFSGTDGVIGNMGGYVIPPISKTFVVDNQFGLSLLTPFRYFTENKRNLDYPVQHVMIYVNLDTPTMFLIGFEDFIGGYDRDYNDIVFSLEQILPPEIVSVTRSAETPNYNQSVTVTAQVTRGRDEIESVILSYQFDAYSWNNVTMNLVNNGYVADIPAQPYNSLVIYKVYAADTNGISSVSKLYSYTSVIPDRSPTAVLIRSPSVVYTGQDIDFSASSSYDPDGNIVSYSWDFGDGTTASGVTVHHSYPENGVYAVTLKVVDNEGLVGNSVTIQRVENQPPVASLTEAASIINGQETVAFDASPSYDLDGTIVTYTWNFGDGTAATGITTTHSYTGSGFYNVTLSVSDDDGATDEYVHSIQVTNVDITPPSASITVTTETGNIDETISFDGSKSYKSDGSIVSYSWDFGDGTTATGVKVDHSYKDNGVYTVTLTIIDDEGAIVSATTIVNVLNKPPVVLLTENATTLMLGETIHFDASESYDSDGTITTYSWDFGDGTITTGVTADHAYNEDGTFTVVLAVTDDDGDSSVVLAEITVETETTTSLSVISIIGVGIAVLTTALIVVFFLRKKKPT